jgi:hypothetical protein
LILGYATKDTKLKDVCPAIPEGEWTIPVPTPITVDARLLCESILDPLFRFFPATKEMKTQKALRMVDRALSRKESLRNGYLSVEFFQGLSNQSIQDLNLEDLQNCIDDGELNFTCVNQTEPVETLRTPSGFLQMPKPGSLPRQVIEEFLQCTTGGIISRMCIVKSKKIMKMVDLVLTDEEFARRAAERNYVLKNSTDFDKAAEEAGYFRNNTELFEVAVEASGYFKKGTRAFRDAASESGYVLKGSKEFDNEVALQGFMGLYSTEFYEQVKKEGYVKNQKSNGMAAFIGEFVHFLFFAGLTVGINRKTSGADNALTLSPGGLQTVFLYCMSKIHNSPFITTFVVTGFATVVQGATVRAVYEAIDQWV